MPVHELRTYRMTPGKSVDDLIQFFHRDGRTDYRSALRAAAIPMLGFWKTAGREDEAVWLRSFESADAKKAACDRLYSGALWKGGLKDEASAVVASVETIDLEPRWAEALAAPAAGVGYHELRHYRIAAGAMPRMLEFFEDVRRVVPPYGVVVLAWWTARLQETERFLWLRQFGDQAHKERVTKELYESRRWLERYKPRTIGVIEERILKDLIPVPAERLGGFGA